MSWLKQAGTFFSEVSSIKANEKEEEQKITKEDFEFVSSASEARLLHAPQGASFLIVLSFLLIVALVAWSILMPVDEVVRAQGKVIPSKQVQNIQNLEGGIIKEINVVEGQHVKKGQLLMKIDDVYAQSDLSENEMGYNGLLARLVAINTTLAEKRILDFPAELDGKIKIMQAARQRFNAEWDETMTNIKKIEFEIEQRKNDLDSAISELESSRLNLNVAREEFKLNKNAYNQKLIPRVEYLKFQRQLNDSKSKYNQNKSNVPKAKAALHEAMSKRETYKAEHKNRLQKEKTEVKAKLDSMQAKGVSLEAKLSHSTIESPVNGIVKKINFSTLGGVIRPGENILEIVPSDDKLLIEAKVKPKDIGFVVEDLKAKVKLTAYDFSTYGGLDGVVKFISADTITDKKGNSFFLVRVLTDKNYIVDKKDKQHMIIPGMQTEVDIVVNQKSILSYILKPMLK